MSPSETSDLLNQCRRRARTERALRSAAWVFLPLLLLALGESAWSFFASDLVPRVVVWAALASGASAVLLYELRPLSERRTRRLAGEAAAAPALFLSASPSMPGRLFPLLLLRADAVARVAPSPRLTASGMRRARTLALLAFAALVLQAVPRSGPSVPPSLARPATNAGGSALRTTSSTSDDGASAPGHADIHSSARPSADSSPIPLSREALDQLAATEAGRTLREALRNADPADDHAAWSAVAKALMRDEWAPSEAAPLASALSSAAQSSESSSSSLLASAGRALAAGASASAGAMLQELLNSPVTSHAAPERTVTAQIDLPPSRGHAPGPSSSEGPPPSAHPANASLPLSSITSLGTQSDWSGLSRLVLSRYFADSGALPIPRSITEVR